MTDTDKSQKCLKIGQNALAVHDYKAVHKIAMTRLAENLSDPAPFYLLAHIALDHGNSKKSEELFQQAVSLEPNDPRYLSAFAKVLSLRGNQEAARRYNEHAAEQTIDDAHVADTIGVVFSRTGFHQKAIPFYKLAISLKPQPDNFHFNLAASLRFLGQFEDAAKSYREAINRNADNVRAYSSLISLQKQTEDKNELNALYALFERHTDSAENRLHIGHAIAKTLEDLGRHPESLDWLEKAKAKKRADLNYDMNVYFDIFEAARKSFENLPSFENASTEAPIFVIGLPRTGTTLVDRIISSHPDVISCGELNAIAALVKKATQTTSQFVMDGETLFAATEIDLAKIGNNYWNETQALRQGYERMTDKMPLNFFYVGIIHRAFPNARIICLRRGAMDSCLSNYRQLFSTSYSYYNYTLSLKDTAAYYHRFDALMNYWSEAIPSDRFMQVHYEDIVFDQDTQTRRLLAFCDLDWNEACMRFHENEAPVSTASSVQVRQPLYSGSIGRWKKYGDKLDGLLDALGDLTE